MWRGDCSGEGVWGLSSGMWSNIGMKNGRSSSTPSSSQLVGVVPRECEGSESSLPS